MDAFALVDGPISELLRNTTADVPINQLTATRAEPEVVGVGQGQSGAGPDPRIGLTPQQLLVMRVLARGASIAEAARAANVHQERVRQWEKTPKFRDALSKERIDPTRSKVAEVLRQVSPPEEQIPASTTARRSKAIDLLASGMMSIAEAAERSGYTRQHLSHLIHHDPQFQAEYRRRLTDEHIRRANFFWAIYDKSGKVVQQSLDEGDPRTALEIFRLGSRGVTDIEDPSWDVQKPALLPPALSMLEADPPASESGGFTCGLCGLEAKSRRGLTQHRNAKHGNHGER